MNQFESEVIDRLGRIEEKIDADFRILHGSGTADGLIGRVGKLESRLQSVEECGKYKLRFWGTLAAVGAFLITIIADFVISLILR